MLLNDLHKRGPCVGQVSVVITFYNGLYIIYSYNMSTHFSLPGVIMFGVYLMISHVMILNT